MWFRILIGVSLPLLFAAGAVYLYLYRSPFPCVFHELTGLYCPGCGAGRAAYSILHLDLLRALGFNALFVLATPFLAYYFLKIYLKIVTGRDLLPLFRVTVRQYSIAVLIILVFTILRNIPVFPFSLLAPGSLFA